MIIAGLHGPKTFCWPLCCSWMDFTISVWLGTLSLPYMVWTLFIIHVIKVSQFYWGLLSVDQLEFQVWKIKHKIENIWCLILLLVFHVFSKWLLVLKSLKNNSIMLLSQICWRKKDCPVAAESLIDFELF